jgi:hypothetical protein
MVAYFFEAGPRLGVPELHTSKLKAALQKKLGFTGHFATGSKDAARMMKRFGQGQSEHDLLAKREKLAPVPSCEDGAHKFLLSDLEKLLRHAGPIFFYWQKTVKTATYGHASVIIGTDDKTRKLIYHDPENAPEQLMGMGDFNMKRQAWKYALMQRKDGPQLMKSKGL